MSYVSSFTGTEIDRGIGEVLDRIENRWGTSDGDKMDTLTGIRARIETNTTNITKEVNDRKTAVSSLHTTISKEIDDDVAAAKASIKTTTDSLQSSITTLQTTVNTNNTTLTNTTNGLNTRLTNVENNPRGLASTTGSYVKLKDILNYLMGDVSTESDTQTLVQAVKELRYDPLHQDSDSGSSLSDTHAYSLKSLLSGLRTDVNNLNTKTTNLTTSLSKEVSDRTAAVQAEATARTTAIQAETTARNTAIQAEVNTRSKKDTEIDNTIAQIRTELGANASDTTDGTIYNRLNELESAVGSGSGSGGDSETPTDSTITDRVSTLETKVEDLETLTENQGTTISGYGTRISNNEQDISDVQQTQTSLTSRVSAVETKATTNATNITSATNRVSSLETLTTTQGNTLSGYDTRISNNEQDISDIQETLGESGTSGTIVSRLDSVESSLRDQSSQISSIQKTTSTLTSKDTSLESKINNNTTNISTNTQSITNLNSKVDDLNFIVNGGNSSLNRSVITIVHTMVSVDDIIDDTETLNSRYPDLVELGYSFYKIDEQTFGSLGASSSGVGSQEYTHRIIRYCLMEKWLIDPDASVGVG